MNKSFTHDTFISLRFEVGLELRSEDRVAFLEASWKQRFLSVSFWYRAAEICVIRWGNVRK